MTARDIEQTLTEHVIALRERLARVESEVGHLAHSHGAHTGQLLRTEEALAHIGWSLRDAHRLIAEIQRDVSSLSQEMRRTPLADVAAKWGPTLWPALLGLLILGATLVGKSDLAARLAALK